MTNPSTIDRLPPHSPEAEQGILGCVMLSPDSIGECIEKLRIGPPAFYEPRNREIYSAMLDLHSTNDAIDIITLKDWFQIRDLIEQVGGLGYLMSLPDTVPSAANLSYYIDILNEKYTLRTIIKVCTEAVSRVYEHTGQADDLMDEVEREIMAIRGTRSQVSELDIKDLVRKSLTRIEEMWERKGGIGGISTGFHDLDRMTDGLHPGEMIVIAGYPGAGKTALAMNIAESVSVSLKLPVAVFSLEMKGESLVVRFIFSNAKVNSRSVAFLNQHDFQSLSAAAGRISAAPIHIDEASDLSVFELRSKARRMVQKHGVKLIVVDYLQLLHASGGARKVESRQQEVTDISRGIKAMAHELGVPVLALSQLNDDGKLRESRAIGQDADGVWILKADETEEGDDVSSTIGVTLEIAKSRNGPVGRVHLVFQKQFTRFESAAKIHDSDVPKK